MRQTERELPMLAGIGAIIHWSEELASLFAGPILTAGLGIALVDLFTDGKLLATTPFLLFAWAISQTVGLDAQLVGSAAKLGVAMRQRSVGGIIGYGLLVLALGYVAFQASNVFATQQAEGITTAQALARLGMDSATWIVERSALAVVLVVLSGLLRYAAPAPEQISLEDERDKLERELQLEPLRQQLRERQVGGWRSVAQTALGGARQSTTTTTNATAGSLRGEGLAYASAGARNASVLPPIRTPKVAEKVPADMAVDMQTADESSHHLEASQQPPVSLYAGAGVSSQRTPDGWDVASPSPPSPDDDPPPTRRRSSSIASKQTQGTNVTPLRRGLGKPPRRDRRVVNRANARSGRRGAAEQRVRAALAERPELTDEQLMRAADVSSSTVSKWRRVIDAERAAEQRAQEAL